MSAVTPPADDKLKVFISYARKDLEFAERLVAALEARGVAARIDVRDLPTLEQWQQELSEFIYAADAVVFVISPSSVASKVCAWEIGRVVDLNKRLAPIVVARVPDDSIPAAASKINYLYFDPPNDFEVQADRLAAALSTDLGWLKEHTRLGEQARRWSERGRPGSLLLRGEEIPGAEQWLLSQPRSAPHPTPLQQAFVTASRAGETRRQRTIAWTSAAAAAIALLLMAGALWQRQLAIDARELADRSRQAAERDLDTAIDTVEKFMLTLTSDLKSVAGLPASKIESILDDAKTQFDRIAAEAPDNAKLRANRAALHLMYAETFQNIGRTKAALERAGEADAIATKLVGDHPGNADYVRLMQVARNRITLIKGSLTGSQQSLADAQSAASAAPDDPDRQRDLAVALSVQGDRQRQTGDTDAALKSYQAANEIITELASKWPSQGLLLNDLAQGYRKLGLTYQDRNEMTRALQAFQSAAKIAKQVADAEPYKTDLQLNLAIAHENVGSLYYRVNDAEKALENHKRALLVLEPLLTLDPQSVVFRAELANCLSYLAGDWLMLKETAKARALEEQSLGILRAIIATEGAPTPSRRRQLEVALNRVSGYQADAGEIAAALDRRREALSLARALLGDVPDSQLYASDVFACVTGIATITADQTEAQAMNQEARTLYGKLKAEGRVTPLATVLLAQGVSNEVTLLFRAKDFKASETLARELIDLQPGELWRQAQLAIVLLFQERVAEADAIFYRHRGRDLNGVPWEKVIVNAFSAGRQRGIEHPHMIEIEKDFGKLP